MPTHSITPGRHYGHEGPGPVPRTGRARHADHAGRATWAVPVALGVVLGLYAVFLAHDNGFGTAQGWLVGLIAALVSTGAGYALLRWRDRMVAEVRAAAFGALLGTGIGFLYSLTGPTVLRAVEVGLLCGLGMALASYYVFHWHEH
ncbi:hypothetical protein BLA24_15500 [Streptomyces cinnamoneus]|uniref:Uncharacterized protein n=1 Tax=Streptomyces cinnamoneus TaxID=53446 RepID=A0A2G1XIW6_STRCJ|nr:hypothetical protein [Streptomyces cinnamoneus]PHQ51165.1 hypothetical protein BLA24_15500 [Streptomyces cinnamoneus]PPT13612.1 hypothetical protein CYQ11_12575 [Streptomyces cinnamoneus]